MPRPAGESLHYVDNLIGNAIRKWEIIAFAANLQGWC